MAKPTKKTEPVSEPIDLHDPEQILAYLDSVDAATANYWIDKNFGYLGPEAKTAAEGWRDDHGSSKTTPEEEQAAGAAEDAARNKLDQEAATDQAKNDQAAQNAAVTGRTQEQEREIIDLAASGSLPPDWVMRNYTDGQVPSAGEVKQLMTQWNEYHPSEAVTNEKELWDRMRAHSPNNEQLADSAFFGIDPTMAYTIRLDGTRTLTVDDTQIQAFKAAHPADEMDLKHLTVLVRTADKLKLQGTNGVPGWAVLAALSQAKGGLAADADPAAGSGRLKQSSYSSRQGANTAAKNPDQYTYSSRQGSIVGSLGADQIELNKMGLAFIAGRMIYGGNDMLGYIHALDPALAARVANTKPEDVSPEDKAKFNQFLLTGGFDTETLAKMGYYALGLTDYTDSKFGDGTTKTTYETKVDSAAVGQRAKDLLREILRREPTDKEINNLIGTVQSAVSGADAARNNAPDNTSVSQSVDADAKIREGIEAMPEYQDLYRNKPGGLSDAEYRNQFDNGAAELLGNERPDQNSIRSGMRSGSFQTTLGQIAASKTAWGNSTFLGRLADAARILNENS